MSDYTPVPEADLEASFMETLALLRQNSTDGHAAMSGLQRLTEQLASEAYRRELEHKNVMSMLDVVNQTLKQNTEIHKEAIAIIKNSKPANKTRAETAIEILKIVGWASIILFCVVMALLAGSELGMRFRTR